MNGSSVQEMGADFVRDLTRAVQRNPISAALIGMGAVWLFTGGGPAERAARLARRAGFDRVPDAASDFADGLLGRVSAVGERVSDFGGSVRDTGSAAVESVSRFGCGLADSAGDLTRRLPERGSDLFDSARSRLSDMLEEQPLVLGAIGLAIGATIAASLPATRIEAEYLGEVSDQVKGQAAEFASDQVQRARSMAENAVSAFAEEAKRQGLTPDALSEAASGLGDKVRRVADAAEAGARNATR